MRSIKHPTLGRTRVQPHATTRPQDDTLGLKNDELLDLIQMVRACVGVLRETMSPDGFNVGLNIGTVAGAGVKEHVHFHIVPRWNGDTNFMTVFSEVRVVPEHIQQTYKKLLPYFTKERLNETS